MSKVEPEEVQGLLDNLAEAYDVGDYSDELDDLRGYAEDLAENFVWLYNRRPENSLTWEPKGYTVFINGNDDVVVDDTTSGTTYTLDEAEDFARCLLSAVRTARFRKGQS